MFDYAISKNFVTLGNANLVPSVTLVEVEVVDLSRLRELSLLVYKYIFQLTWIIYSTNRGY